MKGRILVVLAALLMGLAPYGVEAQGRGQRQQLLRRVEQGFGRLVQTQLGLEPSELASLQGVMQAFREDRQSLNQAQASLRYRLRDPGLSQMDEAQAQELLGEMIQLQEAELDLYRREQESLLSVLAPSQVVLFYRVRDEWARRLQRMREQGGSGGLGPRGGQGGMSGGSETPGLGYTGRPDA